MENNKRSSIEISYPRSKYSRYNMKVFEAEDRFQRERLRAIAAQAAGYLGIEELKVFIAQSSRADQFGSYNEGVSEAVGSDCGAYADFILIPQEAADVLSDDEILAYILSEASGKNTKNPYLAYLEAAAVILLLAVLAFKYSGQAKEIQLSAALGLIIGFGVLAIGGYMLQLKIVSSMKNKTVSRAGRSDALISALNKLFVDKDLQNNKPLLNAAKVGKRIKRIRKISLSEKIIKSN